jgi:hypothetical protein
MLIGCDASDGGVGYKAVEKMAGVALCGGFGGGFSGGFDGGTRCLYREKVNWGEFAIIRVGVRQVVAVRVDK